jgi:hypothetical protein
VLEVFDDVAYTRLLVDRASEHGSLLIEGGNHSLVARLQSYELAIELGSRFTIGRRLDDDRHA